MNIPSKIISRYILAGFSWIMASCATRQSHNSSDITGKWLHVETGQTITIKKREFRDAIWENFLNSKKNVLVKSENIKGENYLMLYDDSDGDKCFMVLKVIFKNGFMVTYDYLGKIPEKAKSARDLFKSGEDDKLENFGYDSPEVFLRK